VDPVAGKTDEPDDVVLGTGVVPAVHGAGEFPNV
jgi:hypothetical protein